MKGSFVDRRRARELQAEIQRLHELIASEDDVEVRVDNARTKYTPPPGHTFYIKPGTVEETRYHIIEEGFAADFEDVRTNPHLRKFLKKKPGWKIPIKECISATAAMHVRTYWQRKKGYLSNLGSRESSYDRHFIFFEVLKHPEIISNGEIVGVLTGPLVKEIAA